MSVRLNAGGHRGRWALAEAKNNRLQVGESENGKVRTNGEVTGKLNEKKY